MCLPIRAGENARRQFEIPAGPAIVTLKRAAQQAGFEIVYSATLVGDVQTQSVSGNLTPQEALDRMVAGTPLAIFHDPQSGVRSVVRRSEASPGSPPDVPTPADSPPHSMKKRTPLAVIASWLALVLSPAPAASAPSGSPGNAAADKASASAGDAAAVVELSPFVVNVATDNGYAATNTLSGTRIATSLRDTAGSLSIVTPELMADLNVTSIQDAILYFPSGNEDLGSPIGGGAQAGDTIRANPDSRKIRGISTTAAARNFFPVAGPVDLYNSERLTTSNGPNSILYGVGGTEGVTVSSTKQARTDRKMYEVGTRFDSNGTQRYTLDLNQPAGGRLAVRVNALLEDKEGFRDGETTEQERVDVAVTIKPLRRTVVRLDYEHFVAKVNAVPLKWALDGGYQSWVTGGRPLIDTVVTGAWTAAERARYGEVLSQSGQSIVFMGNLPGVPAATLNTFRLGQTVARSFGVGSIASYQVPDPMATYGLPRDANLMPGTKAQPHNIKDGHNVSAFVEQRLTDHLFVELAANQTRQNLLQRNATMDTLQIDPNRYLIDGTPNPGYQQLYAQNAARQVVRRDEDLNWRGTASYDLDLKNVHRHLGRHRFAGLWQQDNNIGYNNNEFVVNTIVDGSNGLNRDPLNGQNRLNMRSYFFPQSGITRPYAIYDIFDTPSLADVPDPRNPGRYIYKFSVENTQGPSITERRQEALAAVWQGYLLQDRLVTTLGVRRDKIETWSLRDADWQRRDGTPYYKRATAHSIPGGQPPDSSQAGNTRTFGAVGHVNKWLSLTYNQSEVFNPGVDGIYSADGSQLGPETGETQEIGFRLYLLGDRLAITASRFDAATRGTSAFNPANGTFIGPRNTVFARMQLNWAGTGLVTDIPAEDLIQRETIRGTTDTKLSGWEATAVYNPTRNWRLLVTGSINETVEENRFRAIKELLARDLPLMESWSAQLERVRTTSANPLTASLATTDVAFVNERVLGLKTALADANSTEGRDLAAVAKYGLNAVSSYGFTEGRLAGWRITGRGRYRSAPTIGYYRDNASRIMIDRPFKGEPLFEFGAQVGRNFKWMRRQFEVRLDIANLFDADKPLPQLADTDDTAVFGVRGDMRIVRWALQRPRTFTLSVDVKL